MRQRQRPSRQRAPRADALAPLPALDQHTGPIVLLAFIASGLRTAIAAHAQSVEKGFEQRISVALDHWPQDVARLEEQRLGWSPMRLDVEMLPSAASPLVIAPRITLSAAREEFPERSVSIYLGRLGLVVLDPKGWPPDVRVPAILKDPKTAEDAARNAAATVRALMASMGRFNHPFPAP